MGSPFPNACAKNNELSFREKRRVPKRVKSNGSKEIAVSAAAAAFPALLVAFLQVRDKGGDGVVVAVREDMRAEGFQILRAVGGSVGDGGDL